LPVEMLLMVKLTKLDSSGDAKLNNNTLTFTVKVSVKVKRKKNPFECAFMRQQGMKIYIGK